MEFHFKNEIRGFEIEPPGFFFRVSLRQHRRITSVLDAMGLQSTITINKREKK